MSQTIHMVQDPTDGGRWIIASPYSAKEAIKDLPGRRWDADRRVWTIPSYAVGRARRHLESCGFHVEAEEEDDAATRARELATALSDEQARSARLAKELRRTKTRAASLEQELADARREVAPSGTNPFDIIAAVLPESAHRNFYRRAIRAVHPDTGGSERAAQMLNDSLLGRAR